MALSVAVRVDGALRDCPTDLSTDSVFPIYSITKTLTAVCTLRLCEAGALDLDVPVKHYLPELEIHPAVQLTHLLTHTSGIGDYGPLPEYHRAVRNHPDRPWTRQQFLDAVLPHGLMFEAGAGWAYSNVGSMLVVDILERVTGSSFASLVAEHICEPLELRRTATLETIADLMTCVSGLGPEVTEDGVAVDVRGRYHPGWCAPRLVASTAAETTRIFDALFCGELVTDGSLRRMIRLTPLPGFQTPPMVIGAGMGLFSNAASRYGVNYGHGGAGPGFDVTADIYPEVALGRVAVAIFVDRSSGPRAGDLEDDVIRQFIRQ